MNRILTPAENQYVATLARRLLYITEQADALKTVPLESMHEPTGFPVYMLLCLLMDAAGYTEAEITEALL